MKSVRRLSVRALFVVPTLLAWLALNPAPFTMHVVDEAGRAAAGVRVITDNGIVCFTLLDGTASWTELSLLRRAVQFDVRDDYHRYADASARLQFDSGGHGTVTVRAVATPQSSSPDSRHGLHLAGALEAMTTP